MLCPNCGHDNIAGTDLCESCGSDLAGLDLVEAEASFQGRLMTDHLGDFPLVAPLSVSPEATVAEAVELMRQARQGCVLVRSGSALVGIFTERDVLTRIVRPGRDPQQIRMAEVMTREPVSLSVEDPPAFAIHLSVARGLRHLPVTDGSEVRGFISVRHLLRHIREIVLGNQ